MAFATDILKSRGGQLALTVLLIAQPLAGAYLAREPLTQAWTAIHDAAPLLGSYLRLKAEGKI